MSEMNVDDGAGRQRTVKVTYPGNSRTGKELPPEKKVEKITVGEVRTRKKGLASRISGSMVSERGDSVGSYILFEVLIPAAKNMISDAVSQGVERMLFGEVRSRGRSDSRPGYTNYNKVRSTTGEYGNRDISRRSRTTHDFDEIILSSRGEAEEVLDRLRDLVDKYETATVNDLYDLVGVTGSFTDDKWGWYDLREAMVRATRGGYIVILPRTQPID